MTQFQPSGVRRSCQVLRFGVRAGSVHTRCRSEEACLVYLFFFPSSLLFLFCFQFPLTPSMMCSLVVILVFGSTSGWDDRCRLVTCLEWAGGFGLLLSLRGAQ
ncbi:uncharacterized protein BP01DRAFT_15797 [Aspergillus saccharolyticus JOP 1030-1]|uniref:Uncharacterized protein n=1 Tax=Aspergillus saccharolyticus JOP 1030-1 TaxID=1450539 RepID=A0A318ZG65_9EURO|nr:hypothetical protein BP01DRAFT_15797 [Aspergillus saccharolyticus JOP 1030-1]PYH46449.1 hypothetical protein BP01DRAFT_15797 [Aspergillus saccharolyticus JOP 1030-1]